MAGYHHPHPVRSISAIILRNRITSVAAPILLSAVYGAFIGGVAGACYGSFFFPLIGTIYGLMIGGLGGWIAGLLGVIINHHVGYRIGGLLGAAFCTEMLWYPMTFREAWEEGWAIAIPIALAVLIGWRVDKDIDSLDPTPFNLKRVFREGAPTSGARPYQWLRALLKDSPLVNWSPGKRFTWAACILGLHFYLFFIMRHHAS